MLNIFARSTAPKEKKINKIEQRALQSADRLLEILSELETIIIISKKTSGRAANG